MSPSGALGDPSGSLVLGSNGGVLDVDAGQSLAISGVVSGSGALTKTGAGERCHWLEPTPTQVLQRSTMGR